MELNIVAGVCRDPSSVADDMSECTKIGYRDKFAAELALFRTRTAKRPRGERRIYKCPLCGKWHLTSQLRKGVIAGK
jgi:hypothetical protein